MHMYIRENIFKFTILLSQKLFHPSKLRECECYKFVIWPNLTIKNLKNFPKYNLCNYFTSKFKQI